MTSEELGALVAEWLHAIDVCAALDGVMAPSEDQLRAWAVADALESRVRAAVAEDSERLYPAPEPEEGGMEDWP